jgi:hypothetical protein
LKGIMTREDAKEALRRGDGVIVSNHGGRAEESGQATVGVLVDVVDVVGGKIPVLVDGGVRRGTDVLKALARGAMAVGIGRPYVWGLASFGEAGVDRVLEIMDNEFTTIMRQVGALNINQITRDNVIRSLPLMAGSARLGGGQRRAASHERPDEPSRACADRHRCRFSFGLCLAPGDAVLSAREDETLVRRSVDRGTCNGSAGT